MYRNAAFALVVLVGSAGLLPAQYYRYAPPQASITGVWYMGGDPSKPCVIQVGPGRYGESQLMVTNERGSQSVAFIAPGNRIVAADWDNLTGRLDRDGDAIFWANGSVWRR